MASNNQTIQWLSSGEHLPEFIRDFHDQKDLFRTIDQLQEPMDCEHHRISWPTMHINVIDKFLWFMAKRGYTLQKCRKRVPFDDIHQEIKEAHTPALFRKNSHNSV